MKAMCSDYELGYHLCFYSYLELATRVQALETCTLLNGSILY